MVFTASTPVEMVVGIAQDHDLAELGHVALRYGKSGCNALWWGYYKRLIWFQRRKSASGTSASPSLDSHARDST